MRERGTPTEAERAQRSVKARAVDQGVTVLSYLIGGVLVYGGLGWLGDHFLHTNFLLPVGIILGAALAVYTIIKRFGAVVTAPTGEPEPHRPDRQPTDRSTTDHDH